MCIRDSLRVIIHNEQQPQNRLHTVRELTANQLSLANEILHEIESISDQARENRQQLQNAQWTAKSISQIDQRLVATIDQMMQGVSEATGSTTASHWTNQSWEDGYPSVIDALTAMPPPKASGVHE